MERPSTEERANLDELLFAPIPDEESFPGYTFPVGSGGAQVYGPPETPSGIELPLPTVSVVGDLVAVWGEAVLLGPDVMQVTGLPPMLIDLILLQPPQMGTLVRDGFALGAGDLFTQEDINSGRIGYRHEGEQAGTDSFTFTTPAGEIPTTEIQIHIQEPISAPPAESPEALLPPPMTETATETAEVAMPEVAEMATAPAVVVAETAPTVAPEEEPSDPAPPQPPTRTSEPEQSSPEPTVPPVVPPEVPPEVPPVVLPILPPPWRVSFRVEAVCGTGLALVRLEGAGVWQYSNDEGETWHDVGRVYHGRARLLRSTDRLRFVPYRGATGRVSLGARAWREQESPAGYACLANTQAITRSEAFGPQLLQLRWTLDR
jgi:hypothetical protein